MALRVKRLEEGVAPLASNSKLYWYKRIAYTLPDLIELPEIKSLGYAACAIRNKLKKTSVERLIAAGPKKRILYEYKGRQFSAAEVADIPEAVANGVTFRIFLNRVGRSWPTSLAIETPVGDRSRVVNPDHLFKRGRARRAARRP